MGAIIGLVVGFGAILIAFIGEGGNPLILVKQWTSILIIFGGTAGATILSFPMEEIKRIGKLFKVAFTSKEKDLSSLIVYFKDLAFKTRKNGLLSIEGEITADEKMDPFIKKGLQMIVDGVEPQAVRSIMELESEMTMERHANGAAIFDAAGGYSPTMGIIGTVLGLINVLGSLGSGSTSSLGEKIATAFIATLFGIGFANLVWLPIASRLKAIDKEEATEKSLITEAVLYIQEGVNPNTIAEKLKGFLNKDQLAKFEAMDKKVEA